MVADTESALPRQVEPRPVRLRLLRILPILLVLGLLVHFVLPRLESVEGAISTMRTLAPWAVAMALLFETLSYVANGELLRSIVSIGGGRISLLRAIVIEMAAGSVALVAAGSLGFGAAIYRWTRGQTSRETAMLASWLPSVFDSLTLIVFALIGAVELLMKHQLSRTTETALAIVIIALGSAVGLVIALLVREDWMIAITLRATRLIKRIRPEADESLLIDIAEHASEAWKAMRHGAFWRPALASLLFLTFYACATRCSRSGSIRTSRRFWQRTACRCSSAARAFCPAELRSSKSRWPRCWVGWACRETRRSSRC